MMSTEWVQQISSSSATSANALFDETTISAATNEAIYPSVLSPVPLVRGRSAGRTLSNAIWRPTPVREAKRSDDTTTTKTTVLKTSDRRKSSIYCIYFDIGNRCIMPARGMAMQDAWCVHDLEMRDEKWVQVTYCKREYLWLVEIESDNDAIPF